jgi:trans-L-3-hydroxyproline dehydratase
VILSTVEMHTGGEPTRIVVDGWPRFAGKTLLDKRREAKARFDHLRRGLMLEPRGHDGMYGALLVEPDHPEADLRRAVHAQRGLLDDVRPRHDRAGALGGGERTGDGTDGAPAMPCGLVVGDGRGRRLGALRERAVVRPIALDRIAPTPTWGPVTVDIAYGGAFYAFLSADSIGLDLEHSPMRAIADAGEEIARRRPRPCRSSIPTSPISPSSTARS